MLYSIAVDAGADLSASQYKAVAIGGTIAATSGAAFGIQQNKPAASGRDLTLGVAGRSRCVAGAAISIGAQVMVTTSGYMITATSGNNTVGRVITAAASGETVEGIFNFASLNANLT